MKTPNTIEDEIDRIRLEIYEETKDMTPEQRVQWTNKIAEAIAAKYHITRVERADKKTDHPVRQS